MTTTVDSTQEILDMVDESKFSRSDVLIALRLTLQPEVAKRGKLDISAYAEIITRLKAGEKNSELAKEFNVTASRISEIKAEKSIPQAALKSYLEAKYGDDDEAEETDDAS